MTGKDVPVPPKQGSDSLVFRAESVYGEDTDLSSTVADLFRQLETEYAKEALAEVAQFLRRAEAAEDESAIATRLAECEALTKKLSALEVGSH